MIAGRLSGKTPHYDDWIIFLEDDTTILEQGETVEGEIYDVTPPYSEGLLKLSVEDEVTEPIVKRSQTSEDLDLGTFDVVASPKISGLEDYSGAGWRAHGKSDIPSVNKIYFVKTDEPDLPEIQAPEDLEEFNEEFYENQVSRPREQNYYDLLVFRYFSDEMMDQYREAFK